MKYIVLIGAHNFWPAKIKEYNPYMRPTPTATLILQIWITLTIWSFLSFYFNFCILVQLISLFHSFLWKSTYVLLRIIFFYTHIKINVFDIEANNLFKCSLNPITLEQTHYTKTTNEENEQTNKLIKKIGRIESNSQGMLLKHWYFV